MEKNKFLIIALAVFLIVASIFFIFNRAVSPKARVAFVIDDWGYNNKNIDLALQIDRPITFSVLPNLRYSERIAKAVMGARGEIYDLILHLPLESKSNRAAEVNTIRTGMSEEAILSILQDEIESLPGLIGVSSHQGSKGTEDERVMRIVLKELKKRKLFFVDSMTTSNSACPDIAKDIKLEFAERDVFLDITDQTDKEHFDAYVKKQINELASTALKNGSAIGVGHNIKVTLQAIKDSISELEGMGIKIVPLRELVK